MKVLRSGPTIQKECDRCHSLLEISPTDLGEDQHGLFFVKCAECNHAIHFDKPDIPRTMIEAAVKAGNISE